MSLLDFLKPEAVVPSLRASSKKQALQELSAQAAKLTGLDERTIFEALLQRERLGSTGIGDGIAIPHGKLPSMTHLFGLVDVLFLLLAPEGAGADHLKALSRAARVLRQPGAVERIRAARDAAALYAVLTATSTPQAA